jgi:hypothetical protein
MAGSTRKRDSVQGAVELGPRSMALLRRILLALEALSGPTADPGKQHEDEEVEWPEG